MLIIERVKRFVKFLKDLESFNQNQVDVSQEIESLKITQSNTQKFQNVDRRTACYLGNNTAIAYTIFGRKIFLDTRDVSLTPHLILDGFWEMWITDFIRHRLGIAGGDTVIEVGSNVGYYTLIFAELVQANGSIIAVEANPSVFALLRKTIDVNSFNQRVELHNFCASDAAGEIDFFINQDYLGGSSIINIINSHSIKVPTVPLDDILQSKGFPKIKLLKIDAEGSEGRILKGMQECMAVSPPMNMILEFIPSFIEATGISANECLDFLLDKGYKIYTIEYDSSIKVATRDYILSGKHETDLLLSLDKN